jgi:protein MpaA
VRWRTGVGLIALGLVGACSRTGGTTTAATVTTTAPVATPALTTSPPATIPTTIPTTTIPTTTIPATTAAGTTAPPPATTAPATAAPANDVVRQIELGRSVEDRPITAVERGTPGGTVVLVIGCIHGDEDAGIGVVDDLMTAALPPGVDLWLVPTMNPDGQADQTRTNAHQVDLNRNFPQNWAPLGQPGDSQYAGTGPASEPETAAVVALVKRIRPALAVWYHQDLNRIDPGTGHSGEVRRRYAELTGLPMAPVTGGTYTGTATQWESALVPKGAAFIVELGPTLDGAGAETHANAILTLASTG